MNRLLMLAVLAAFASVAPAHAQLAIVRDDHMISVRRGETELLRYWLTKPPGTALSVESASFFHPLATPSGIPVTEVGPADHKHHRGIFLGWVEMHGRKDADFWGWGAHAPVTNRVIVATKDGTVRSANGVVSYSVENEWRADGEAMIVEKLDAQLTARPEANWLDLHYALTPTQDITLARWAFSGFCVRTRRDGKLTAFSPKGEVRLPNPVHTNPDSDWPAERWYAVRLALAEGQTIGVAVIDHPANPPTLWHNHRDTFMLNPCIVAPKALELKQGKTLHLRYRVVAFDGEPPASRLNRLAQEFAKSK